MYLNKLLATSLFTAAVFAKNLTFLHKSADPCSVIASQPNFSYEEAVACNSNFAINLDSIPFHFDSLRSQLQFYAFIDITKSSPTYQIPSQTDIVAELTKIEKSVMKGEIKDEFSLHNRLVRFFISLKDGHLDYTASCNINFYYKQPFPLISLRDQFNNLIVKVIDNNVQDPTHVEFWQSKHNLNITKYQGKQILLINNQLPMEYLQNYADKDIGISRDGNSRLSLVFARPIFDFGRWGLSYGAHQSTYLPPQKPYVTYTFKMDDGSEERVKVPYLVTNPGGFTDSQSFFDRFCSNQATLKVNVEDDKVIEKKYMESLKIQQVEKVHKIKPDVNITLNNNDARDLYTPIVNGFFVQAHILPNTSTGVLLIPSFAPLGPQYFVNEIRDAFQKFKAANVTNLIIDFSNNGGGYICLGYWFNELLFPNSKNNYFPTDMKSSDILDVLVEKSTEKNRAWFFDAKTYQKQESGEYFADAKSFINRRSFTRGGTKNSTYTQLHYDACPNNPFKDLIQQNDNKPQFPAQNITIVSNGICYSTCALVNLNLQLNQKVTKSVVIGGDNNIWKPATLASSVGGTVLHLFFIMFDLKRLNLMGRPDSPQWPPYKIAFSTTIRQAYRLGSDIPLEFEYVPATKKLAFNEKDVLDPYQVWVKVDKAMN